MRKIRIPRGWSATFNAFPPLIQAEIGAFLTRATFNPRDPSVIAPPITKLNADAHCESTLPSGYRVIWTVGSFENHETIDLFEILPPK